MRPSNAKVILFTLALLLYLLTPTTTQAHGTIITITVTDPPTVHINALYDTGDPMSEAQILIYAADNPRQAWQTGTADRNGDYSFEVDPTIIGQWVITIRTAGHGEIRHLYIAANGTMTLEQSRQRPFWQTVLLAITVILALLAIAWYYSPRGNKINAHS